MDIEGLEVELLEHLIDTDTIRKIDYLYVEFHSQFQKEEESEVRKQRELEIVRYIESHTDIKLRIWH